MLSKTFIEQFYIHQKQWLLVIGCIAVASLIGGIVLLCIPKLSYLKYFSMVFIMVGILQAGFAFMQYQQCDKKRVNAVYAFDLNPTDLKEKELPTIQQQASTYHIITIASLAIVTLTIAAIIYLQMQGFSYKNNWYNMSVAIGFQAIIMLMIAYIAKPIFMQYSQLLQSFFKK